MFLIGLRRSGRCFPTLFACANVRFRPSGYSSTSPMSFLHECLLQKSCTPGLPFFSLPSFSRAGWGWVVSRCPCVASRGFSSPARPKVEDPLVTRSVHGSSLLSPRFVCGLRFQELLSGGELLLPVLSRLALPPQLCTLGEVLGKESLRWRSLLPLLSHLCTLGEVVGPVSRPSAAPVRVLPGLPILGLGSREGVWARSWSIGSRGSLVAHAVTSLSVRGQWSRRCVRWLSRLLVYLVRSLYDHWRSTDRSRFHSVRYSGFGVAGGGFLTASEMPFGLEMPLCCFPRVFLSRSTKGGGSSGHAFGARELASVSSVRLWTKVSGVALWRRTPATCSVPVGSPSSTLHARRGVGEGESSVAFSVASPVSSLHARRGGWAGESPECCSS